MTDYSDLFVDDEYQLDSPGAQSWILFYPERPWTINKDRNLHPMQRAAIIKKWRNAYVDLAKDAGIPKLQWMVLDVIPLLPDRRLQDTAACVVAEKAAGDGVVEAGIIPDDKNEFLKWIRFRPCVVSSDKTTGLILRVTGVPV